MILDIPFYKNDGDGNQCLQVAMKIVLKYFLDKDYSLEELDRLSGRKPSLWTYTSQIVPVLHDLGLKVKYYSKESLEPFLKGEKFIREHFGKDAQRIIEKTDIESLVKATENLLNYDLFEKKVLTLADIEGFVKKDFVSIVLIDRYKITGEKGPYHGHFVVVTGFDDEFIYYHDSGPVDPTPNKKVKKEVFEKAFNANGTDNDCVVVFFKVC